MDMAGIGPRGLAAVRLDLDLFEKAVVAACLGLLAVRLVPGALQSGAYLNILLLVSESLVVLFVLIRRRTTTISRRGFDWLFGFAGTFAPLLVISAERAPVVPIEVCAALLMGGLCLDLWAKLTLRRSFGIVAANRGVKIRGPYRLVRHPMYAGYMLTHLGFFLSGPNLWNGCIYGLVLGLHVVRILAEERVLNRDPAYRELSARVHYRLAPFVF
jgi:protein-S-isoprenylcysteine O-methyltransferase Ste14